MHSTSEGENCTLFLHSLVVKRVLNVFINKVKVLNAESVSRKF